MSQIKRPVNMGDMESIIIEKNIDRSRWLPISVDDFRNDLKYGALSSLSGPSRSNIAYNLQYLEYIELQLGSLNLTSPLICLLHKNFIIVAVSIIEMIFYHLAQINGKIKMLEYEKIYFPFIQKPKDFTPPKPTDKYQIIGYKKLASPIEAPVTFQTLVQIVRDNHFLNDTDLVINNGYITFLRKELRNKVHLTVAKEYYQTDYNTFHYINFISAKVFLFNILTDSNFGKEYQKFLPPIYITSIKQIEEHKKNESTQPYRTWKNLA